MEERTHFLNSKVNKISCVLNIVDNNQLVVVLAHAFGSFKEGSTKKLSDKLAAFGINSLRFDFYGHGESEGDISQITISEGVDEIKSAVKFLKDKGFKDIGLLGISFGGGCSILAASQLENIKCLALRAPVADFYVRELMFRSKEELRQWQINGLRDFPVGDGTTGKLHYNFFEDSKKNRGLIEATKITAPTFIVHGDQDERVPLLLSQMLEKAIPKCEVKVIAQADHVFTNLSQREESLNLMVEFVAKFKK